MAKRRNAFPALFTDSLMLGVAANQVIAMRLMKMATGDVDAHRETSLMVTEKLEAAAEASMAAARSVATGNAHHAAGRALAAYQKRVNKNLRRLSK